MRLFSLKLSFKQTTCLILAVLFATVASSPQIASAMQVDDTGVGQFYSDNDITFYSAQACPVGNTASIGIGSLVGNTNAEQIWNYIVAKGLTAEQAAGVMGNIQQESGFVPDTQEIGAGIMSRGYGIIQWTGGRRTNLETAAAEKGVPASDMLFQLDYMYEESNARASKTLPGLNEWEGLTKQTSVEDSLVYWHDNAERSADTAQFVIEHRGKFAQDAYNSFKTLAPISAPTPTSQLAARKDCDPGLSMAVAPTGDIAKTVLAYAWPTYKGDTLDTMPAYAAAVQKARGEGRYIGTTPYLGIDCGAFVSLVLQDSGFDPTYNSSGKGGNTDSQEAWAKEHWELFGKGNEIDTGKLQPGYVAFQPGHTFIYVGDIPGFNSKIASASWDTRAPMAGTESLISSDVTWYRKK